MKRSTKHDKKKLSERMTAVAERTEGDHLLSAGERNAARDTALDSLRSIAWFRHLCEQAGAQGFRASDLENHWLRFGSKEKTAALHHVDWRPYARGSQKPSEKTLHLVEMHYPGTRKMFEEGELNLWAILRGDIPACTTAVDEQIAHATKQPRMVEFGLPFESKVQHFKEMLIDPALMSYYDPLGHLLMGRRMPNPIANSYLWARENEQRQAMRQAAGETDADNGPSAGKMISPGLAVATIALSQLATAYRDSFIEADYMMAGLLYHALGDQFPAIGDELGEFLVAMSGWRDTGAMKLPGPAGEEDER